MGAVLLRERLDAQRRRILAQAQVGASLCHLFACAALQQLEEVAETSPSQDKKGSKKARVKKSKVAAQSEASDIEVKCTDCTEAALGGGAMTALAAVTGEALNAADTSIDFNDCSGSTCAPSSPAPAPPHLTPTTDSDESTSTRASSEEPPDEERAMLATGARRLMQEMGWRPEVAGEATLNEAEVAAWHEQHPCYRQAICEERQRLKTQFQKWVAIPRRA